MGRPECIKGKRTKNIKIAMLVLVVFLSSFGFAAAQVENDTKKVVKTPPPPKKDCPSEETCELWGEFKEKYGMGWHVRWNKYTGTPEKIYGYHYDMGMGEVTDERKTITIAEKFISDNKDLFKVNVTNLKLSRVVEGNGAWRVEYNQFYDDIPVKSGQVAIVMTNTSKIYDIQNYFYPNISISTTPQISKDEAIDIAKNKMNVISPVVQNASLIIFPYKSDEIITYYLTWNVRLFSLEPLQGNAYAVDAITGDIIAEGNWLRTAGTPTERAKIIKTLLFEKLRRNLLWIAGVVIIAFVLVLKIRRRSK